MDGSDGSWVRDQGIIQKLGSTLLTFISMEFSYSKIIIFVQVSERKQYYTIGPVRPEKLMTIRSMKLLDR